LESLKVEHFGIFDLDPGFLTDVICHFLCQVSNRNWVEWKFVCGVNKLACA